eukprot:gene10153-8056_t
MPESRTRGRSPTLMRSLVLASLCLAGSLHLRVADAHGFLLTPLSRNIRSYYDPPPQDKEYLPHGLRAGGPAKVKEGGGGLPWPNGGFGVCGDPYDATEPKWITPLGKTTYLQGETIQVQSLIHAYHRGRFGLSICPYTSDQAALEACLQRPESVMNSDQAAHEACLQRPESIMARADSVYPGMPWYCLESVGDGSGTKTLYTKNDSFSGEDVYTMTYRLPTGLVCDHCVMRWYYGTSNSCQPPCTPENPFYDPADPVNGCNIYKLQICGSPEAPDYPEEFWNCADIEIIPSGGKIVSPPLSTLPPPPPAVMATSPPPAAMVVVVVTTPWNTGSTWSSSINFYISQVGGDAVIPAPWTLEVSSPSYVAKSGDWNMEFISIMNGTLAARATKSWQSVKPNMANDVNMGLIIEASSENPQAFYPLSAKVNGMNCAMEISW